MSLIQSIQKVNLLNERSKTSFLSGDFSLLITEEQTSVFFGEPVTKLYSAKYFGIADPYQLSLYNTRIQEDINTCVDAVNKVQELSASQNTIFSNASSRYNSKILSLHKQSKYLDSLSTSLATWGHTETFYNTDFIDVETTTCFIDFKSQACFLPSTVNNTVSLLGALEEFSVTSCYLIDPDPELLSDKVRAISTSKNALVSILFRPGDKTITEVKLFPIGNKTQAVVELYQNGNWNPVVNAVLTEPATFPIMNSSVELIRLNVSYVGEDVNQPFGLEKFVFSQLKFDNKASLYSTVLTPSVLFNSYKVVVDENVPTGCQIKYFIKLGSGSWLPVTTNTWKLNSNNSTSEAVINLSSLENNGLYFYSDTLDNISEGVNEGTMIVGRDQFEVSAFTRIAITEKTLLPTLSSEYFENKVYKTCWTTPTVVEQSTTATNSVEYLLSDYGDVNTTLSKTSLEILGEQDSGFDYTSLTVLPINQTYGQSSLRPNTVYRVKTRFFANKESFIDFGKFWFLQGYKTPSSRTFQQQGIPYGSFILTINGVVVAQSNNGYTLYTNGTSESGASTGLNWSFYINKGWNDWELILYVPELPDLINDSTIDSSKYLQLTIYPNPLDATFKSDYDISEVVASGEYPPTTEFDLAYNFPKSFKYWAWKQSGVPNKVALNKSAADLIDGFIGLTDSNQPNLGLKYKGFDSSVSTLENSTTIQYRADLVSNTSTTLSPWIKQISLLTK